MKSRAAPRAGGGVSYQPTSSAIRRASEMLTWFTSRPCSKRTAALSIGWCWTRAGRAARRSLSTNRDAIYRGREDFIYRITAGELPVLVFDPKLQPLPKRRAPDRPPPPAPPPADPDKPADKPKVLTPTNRRPAAATQAALRRGPPHRSVL
jgi:hypothetical protein